jgi:hypothetical protein
MSQLFTAKLSTAQCVPSAADPFGQVCSGYVDLETIVFSAQLHYQQSRNQYILSRKLYVEGIEYREIISDRVYLDFVDNNYQAKDENCLLEVCCAVHNYEKINRWYRFTFLILEPSSLGHPPFNRIGIAGTRAETAEAQAPTDACNAPLSIIRII